MRCMAIIKASPESEAGILPSERQLTAMGAFNQELLNAGVLLGGEGCIPARAGCACSWMRTAAVSPPARLQPPVN